MSTITDAPLRSGAWRVDPEASVVAFAVRHLGVATVRGTFAVLDGTLQADADGLRVQGAVDATSVDTGSEIRDRRLRDELFLAGAHPAITLTGVEFRAGRRHARMLSAHLTIRTVTRPVTLRLRSEPLEDGRLRVRGDGEISRAEFGLDWAALREAGRLRVADRVKISADVVVRPVP